MNEIWNDKKKRTILIASICAVLLLIVIAAVMLGGNNDAGKDVYELFPWGTSKEKVFQKLDQMNVDYTLYEGGDRIEIPLDTFQGSDRFGQADLYFGHSGLLREIKVETEFMDYHNEESVKKWSQGIADTMNKKYGKKCFFTGDGGVIRHTKDWDITGYLERKSGYEVRFRMEFKKPQ